MGFQRVCEWFIGDMEEVDGKTMSIVAFLGIIVNIGLERILGGHGGHGHSHGGHSHGHAHRVEPKNVEMTRLESGGDAASYGAVGEEKQHRNVNMDAAYIHVIGDLIQSIGVMIAGIIIWWNPAWQVIDPLCPFLFAGLVMYTTLQITWVNINVLLEAVPDDVNIDSLRAQLVGIEDDVGVPIVTNVHDLHVWNISPGNPLLTVHMHSTNKDMALTKAHIVCREHGIHHATIQVNGAYDPCSSRLCCEGHAHN